MRKDGTVFPAELTANEMRLDGRHYFVGAIRDITARKRDITARKEAEKRLHTEEMARQSAEEANRLKSEFLNNMSHELRTPLHAILGFSQLGAGHLSDLSLQKLGMYFAQINQAGQRLLLLVNDLLDLSKLEAGMMSFELKQCDLGRVLDQVKSEIAVLLPSKHLKLTVQQETVDLGGWFDHDLILRVLVNLLSNAVKFSPEHGEIVIFIRNGKIKSGTGQSVPALEVEVCDQGAGITLGDEEAIFDKFVQSGKQRAGQGTGLGLAICREIITRHQGKIWACNRQTGGAALSFTLLRQLS
jgi:signal transduction histidine kinase